MPPGNMKKMADAKKTGKSSPKKMIIIISSLVVVVAAGIVLSVVYWPKKAPDPTKMTKENAVKYAASKEFAQLPEKERLRYFEGLNSSGNPWEIFRNSNLTEAERSRLRENAGIMFRRRMEEQARKLLAMTPAEREKEYDRIAEEIKKRMAERGARNPNGGPPGGPGGQGRQGGGPGGGGNNVARMQQRYEGTSSDTRAIMAEMHKAMQKRLPAPPSGPPR